ncbi:tRNA-dihydrouridine synthase family protein [Lentisphaera marina]|uniref:tRNA dihydrouridine synthase n=1 Tax=Lentisphaera marina TaxID=1111041 RepID=UPI002365BA1B|nr:tRNA-dihydrouridine synthase family protein [Lentisphaera marina]MDD7983734.1 tRNA-dihydrouridine synthase family protein [Lentisphaera marina]
MTSSFPFKLSLAPMEGVTHPLMRNQIAQHGGLDLLCTEFIRISSHKPSLRSLKKQIVKSGDIPLSVQIMGNNAELMAESAKLVVDCGADVVDVNMGCPTKRAVKGGVGSAMLKDPKLCYSVLASMREQVPCALSAKIRAGFDNKEDVFEILKAIVDSGADYLAVHPRRRVDHYEGHSDWRIIAALKEKSPIPVIGNGDVRTAADAIRMFKETQCDGVMIGRGALANPWIFLQTSQILSEQEVFIPQWQDIYEFYKGMCDAFEDFCANESGALNKTKEMLMYFSLNLPDPAPFRKAIGRSQSLEEMMNKLHNLLKENQELCGTEICSIGVL